jgi:enediyne biosynthesis protein CalE5
MLFHSGKVIREAVGLTPLDKTLTTPYNGSAITRRRKFRESGWLLIGGLVLSAQRFDPAQYKAGQRREWDQAAEAWKRWWPTLERTMKVVSDRLVELARVQEGQRVLDIATGIGEPAVTAARRVGPAGRVVATDISPHMLEIASERVAAEGLSNIEFVEADAEALDFPENSFDAVLCRFALMFLPDVNAVLQRVLKLLVPGGRFAAAVWGPAEKVPMTSVPMAVIRRELNLPAPEPGTPGAFSLADPDLLKEIFVSAGFSAVHTERLMVSYEMASAEEFVSFRRDVAAHITVLVSSEPPERQKEIWRAVVDAMSPYVASDGKLRVENEAILIVGQR